MPKIIKYRTINDCLAAFYGCPESEINKTDGEWVTMDSCGRKKTYSNGDAIKRIRKGSCWGWVENKDTIHCFVRKRTPMKDLIHLFSHELGHKERPYFRSAKEEEKAEKYAKIAVNAYKIASKIHSAKTVKL